MVDLLGKETFKIWKRIAEIKISSVNESFEYTLTIDGKSLMKFEANNTRVWLPKVPIDQGHTVVLGECQRKC